MSLTTLAWHQPWWLLLAALPLLPPLLRYLLGRGGTYAAAELLPWVELCHQRSWWRRLFSRDAAYVSAWLLLTLAAAGPRFPVGSRREFLNTGPDLVAVVDLSRSMNAADVMPNRRRRTQLELFDMLQHVRGDRVGIIVYAGRPHLYLPPTPDRQAVRFYLSTLDRLVLPTRGSELAPALALARQTLSGAHGVVMVLTDGDLARWEAIDREAQALAKAGDRLYVLGIGTPQGAAIPLKQGGWLEHDGQPVISQMDEASLRALAHIGGGHYQRVTDDGSDWAALLSGLARQDPNGRAVKWHELYPWMLLPAVVLLFVALMPYGLRRAALLLPLAALPALPRPALAAGDGQAIAYHAFELRHYAAAATLYVHVPGYAGEMGVGASHFRAGDYGGATRAFDDAVLLAESDHARADALFDLGATLYRLGDYAGAVQVFGDVLLYRPNDATACQNLKLSRMLLQAVKTRLASDALARHAGRGPRSARAANGVVVDQGATLSFSDRPHKRIPPPAALPADAEALLARGLAHIALVTARRMTAPTPMWQQDLAMARLRMVALDDDPAALWKSIFESEEGYLAPLNEPRTLSGVMPW